MQHHTVQSGRRDRVYSGNDQLRRRRYFGCDSAQEDEAEETLVPYTKTNRLKSEDKSADEDTQEYREKLTIILSIKVAEMIKKLKLLTEGLTSF